MLEVVILGTGNVATHLFHAVRGSKGAMVRQVYGRTKKSLTRFAEHVPVTNSMGSLLRADIYLLAVSDDAISKVSGEMGKRDGMVVHVSGNTAMDRIQAVRKGVFYPLQTFSKNIPLDFSKVPLCLEAENEKDLHILKRLASAMGNPVFMMSSEQRSQLHLCAVLVNNFVNHLYAIAQGICEGNALPFEILHPLIYETSSKIKALDPFEAQTGPARRNDVNTMQHHIEQLGDSLHKKIYLSMSESIRQQYEKKL